MRLNTLALDRTQHDLTVDASRNIALATGAYAVAQDVGCACATFQGECWYDDTIGLPYFADILGKSPPPALIKQLYVAQALTVPSVVKAVCYLDGLQNRNLTGQVQATTEEGQVVTTAIATTPFVLDQSVLGGTDVIV